MGGAPVAFTEKDAPLLSETERFAGCVKMPGTLVKTGGLVKESSTAVPFK